MKGASQFSLFREPQPCPPAQASKGKETILHWPQTLFLQSALTEWQVMRRPLRPVADLRRGAQEAPPPGERGNWRWRLSFLPEDAADTAGEGGVDAISTCSSHCPVTGALKSGRTRWVSYPLAEFRPTSACERRKHKRHSHSPCLRCFPTSFSSSQRAIARARRWYSPSPASKLLVIARHGNIRREMAAACPHELPIRSLSLCPSPPLRHLPPPPSVPSCLTSACLTMLLSQLCTVSSLASTTSREQFTSTSLDASASLL